MPSLEIAALGGCVVAKDTTEHRDRLVAILEAAIRTRRPYSEPPQRTGR
jgi:hypothetical protein